jgi:hypothetical protein
MKSPLSNELKVICEIYSMTAKNEKVWLAKLQQNLAGELSENTIRFAIDTLLDWSMIKIEYGETEKRRAGRLYRIIDKDTTALVKELYERYWKDRKIVKDSAIFNVVIDTEGFKNEVKENN